MAGQLGSHLTEPGNVSECGDKAKAGTASWQGREVAFANGVPLGHGGTRSELEETRFEPQVYLTALLEAHRPGSLSSALLSWPQAWTGREGSSPAA